MKGKLAVALAVLLFATAVHADTTSQTILSVTATECAGCYAPEGAADGGFNALSSVDMTAQFTMQEMTGQFSNPEEGGILTGTLDEVVSITGTFNGYSMRLAESPYGGQSWLDVNDNLGAVFFTLSDGSLAWMFSTAATSWKYPMPTETDSALAPGLNSERLTHWQLPSGRRSLLLCC
jgi:hypothetical protein